MAKTPVIYTLRIELDTLQMVPPIWRRIHVSGDCTLRRLHHFIQAAMGWSSCHLHGFVTAGAYFTPPDPDAPAAHLNDDRKHKLQRVLGVGDQMRYDYDFGDNWEHLITVEAIEPTTFIGTWCDVLDGSGACPPEDVGGIPGYVEFLQAIRRVPLDSLGRDCLNWAGGSFNAEAFDRRAASASVLRICNNYWG